jgi:hypothetical protein
MPVDERARHLLFRKLEAVLGQEEAGTLMDHLPPSGFTNLATKEDLLSAKDGLRSEIVSLRTELVGRIESLEHRLTASVERSLRKFVMWTASMVLASTALAFAAGRFV